MFIDLYQKTKKEKNSILCVGLDVILQNVMAEGREEALIESCLDLVEKTSDYACAYKPNSQFILFDLNIKHLQKLNKKIHKEGCITILDHKLGDIGASNHSALYWIKEAGFDSFTFSPFAGNILETTTEAHRKDLGVFVLTLMSNPESAWVQKDSLRNGVPLYLEIAEKVKESRSDGVVVGATDNASIEDIKKIREKIGEDKIFLCPGVGAQGGDAEKIIKTAGENLLINVGRTIINDAHPTDAAKEYSKLFNRYR